MDREAGGIKSDRVGRGNCDGTSLVFTSSNPEPISTATPGYSTRTDGVTSPKREGSKLTNCSGADAQEPGRKSLTLFLVHRIDFWKEVSPAGFLTLHTPVGPFV